MTLTGIAVVAMLALFVAVAPACAADCTDPAGPGVDWQRCYLDRRDLAGQTLTGAKLTDASFERTNLTKCNLAGAIGFHAKFISAIMPKTILDTSGTSAPVPYIAIDPQTSKPVGAPK